MFNFNLKEAAIYRVVKLERWPVFRLAQPLKKLFFILFILTFSLFLYGFLTEGFSQKAQSFTLGLTIIFLTLTIIARIGLTFFNSKLKKPELKIEIREALARPEKLNLAEFLSFELAKAVSKSIKFAKSKKLSEINSNLLFYFLLTDNPKLNFIFSRALLNLNEIKSILKTPLVDIGYRPNFRGENYSKDFQETILESLKIAQEKRHQRIEIGDTLTALAKHNLFFQKILIEANLKVEDIENLTWWLEFLEEKIEERKRWWEYHNLMKHGTLAKEWAAGYTITLDQYSTDLSKSMKKMGFPEHIGHENEIMAVERILARSEINNVLLVGEPGAGKKAIIQGFQVRSLLGQSLPELNYKRVVALDIPFLLSQISGRETETAEATLDKIFQETVLAGNVILTINDFHNFVGGLERPGVIDITGVISSYLQLPQFQLIAITTYDGLHKYIERQPSLLALFEKVEVSEISPREALQLLENLALKLEWKYRRLKKFISYPAIREIITLSERYLPALPFPKKAMDLLDEVMVYVSSLPPKEKIVLPAQVAKIFSEKFQIPVGEIEIKEREILLNLENLIHQRIINQEEAVKEVSTAMRRARAEITIRKGPMGCFLFLGPTGVGKTETSKALAEIYFGSEEKMIRMDMSEFQNITDIPRLISSPTEEGLLTTQVRENPFSLILLDEIEKSHPNILNLFLQVFDEGHLTDGLGRKVDFRNSIIIATSNAGYQVILKALKEKAEWSGVKEKLLDFLFAEGIFRPEFINRFDAVVVFKPLTKENLLDIAELLLQKLKKNLKEKGVEFIITKALKEKIVELGYSPVFGAREMRRVIQDKVENVLASALLSGQLKRGQRAEIDPNNFQLKINP